MFLLSSEVIPKPMIRGADEGGGSENSCRPPLLCQCQLAFHFCYKKNRKNAQLDCSILTKLLDNSFHKNNWQLMTQLNFKYNLNQRQQKFLSFCHKHRTNYNMKSPVLTSIFLLFIFHACTGARLGGKSVESGKSVEKVNSITTKTSNCFQCGMIEGLGFLDVKVNKTRPVWSGFKIVVRCKLLTYNTTKL